MLADSEVKDVVLLEETNLSFVCYENFTEYFDRYNQAKFWIEGKDTKMII